MNEQDVVSLLKRIEGNRIGIWIDGGWGVDALVGYQTRPHNDIDIFVERKDATAIIDMLAADGYGEVVMDFTTVNHTAWRDSTGREIDLHLFEIVDADTLRFDNDLYPSSVLSGQGCIGGVSVRCLTAEAQLLYHQGYEHTDKDTRDVLLLCKAFGFKVPEQYR